MKILVVEPLKAPYITEIEGTLESLQEVVGGWIQELEPWSDEVAVICNDEGKLMRLPLNRVLRDEEGHAFDIIAGTFFICGTDGEDFSDIPADLIDKYTALFRMPEIIF